MSKTPYANLPLVVGNVNSTGSVASLHEFLALIYERSAEQSDGRWLEDLTVEVAPVISDWNIASCCRWEDWPDREQVMPAGTPASDVGIDLVSCRRDDGKYVAIQCKSRKLDDNGEGAPVASDEINKFLAASANSKIWAERWNCDERFCGFVRLRARQSCYVGR